LESRDAPGKALLLLLGTAVLLLHACLGRERPETAADWAAAADLDAARLDSPADDGPDTRRPRDAGDLDVPLPPDLRPDDSSGPEDTPDLPDGGPAEALDADLPGQDLPFGDHPEPPEAALEAQADEVAWSEAADGSETSGEEAGLDSSLETSEEGGPEVLAETSPAEGWTEAFAELSPNQPPVAKAGSDVAVKPGFLAWLDGSDSYDPEGVDLAFAWAQLAGPDAMLVDADTPTPKFLTPMANTTLTFELVVSDGISDSPPDQVVVSVVNGIPLADAGINQEVTSAAIVSLDGTASSDPDGHLLSFLWKQTGGAAVSLDDQVSPTPKFAAPGKKGMLAFTLTVSDGIDPSPADTVVVTVLNNAPTAQAGADVVGKKNFTLCLDGSASSDPDGDPLAFSWSQLSGDPLLLDDASAPKPCFESKVTGLRILSLTVTDNDPTSPLSSAPDSVSVTIE
jgi:hypothetical protein